MIHSLALALPVAFFVPETVQEPVHSPSPGTPKLQHPPERSGRRPVEPRPVRARPRSVEPVEDARITIEVFAPKGEPHVGGKQIYIRTDSGGTVARVPKPALGGAIYTPSTWALFVPPGAYEIVAAVEPSLGCEVPKPHPRASHMPGKSRAVIRAGETRTIQVHLGKAGHLDLVPRSPRTAPSLREAADIGFGEERSADFSRVREHYGGRAIRLTWLGEVKPREVSFETPTLGVWARYQCYEVFPGWTARSLTPIPAGCYRLEIDSPDGAPLVRDVEIFAGEVTEVVW